MITFIVITISAAAIFMLTIPTMFYINDPSGAPISPEISSNYKKGKWDKNKVYYLAGGNMSGTEILDADLESFQVIDFRYAKDKNHIYYEHSPINVDNKTFYLDKYVPKDKNHAYYIEDAPNSGHQATIIEGANPKTYKELEGRVYWGKDTTHYYFKTQQIDVDYASFEFISNLWAKDSNAIYLLDGFGVKKTTLDTATFKQINSNYAQDNQQIVFASWVNSTPPPIYITFPLIPNAPIEVLTDIHLKHDDKIYLRGKLFDVDIDSFHAFIFNEETSSSYNGFSKDKNHVYIYDKILKEADPESFNIVDGEYKDKNNRYWGNGKIIPEKN